MTVIVKNALTVKPGSFLFLAGEGCWTRDGSKTPSVV